MDRRRKTATHFFPKYILSNESQLKLCPSLSSVQRGTHSYELFLEGVHGLVIQAWTPGGGGKPNYLVGDKGHMMSYMKWCVDLCILSVFNF